MRALFWFITLGALAVGLALAAQHNNGYALFVLPPAAVGTAFLRRERSRVSGSLSRTLNQEKKTNGSLRPGSWNVTLNSSVPGQLSTLKQTTGRCTTIHGKLLKAVRILNYWRQITIYTATGKSRIWCWK